MRRLIGERDREILRLAIPAFLALVAEPLFLLTDAAVVGHLGTRELAGLGIAAVVLQTIVGLCVFLAYGTTAAVARLLGVGDLRRALAQGVDGIWLAVVIGVLATAIGIPAARPILSLFDASPAVTDFGVTYLQIALLGTTPLLMMLAATGVLRGLLDVRTPVIVAVAGNLLNAVLNIVLVFGVGPVGGLGIAGSAIGSVIAQVLSAAALVWVVARGARRHNASLRPDLRGIRAAARAGVPLVVRTLTLRAALMVTTYAAALSAVRAGDSDAVTLAANQLAFTIWGFLAFVLDAIAIAAQALTGRSLGAGDVARTRETTERMARWGVGSGMVTGLLLVVSSPLVAAPVHPDEDVQRLLTAVLIVIALAQPMAGVVFVLDGVLIGAGDGRYLAWAGLAVLAVYAPLLLLAPYFTQNLTAVWVGFVGVFMGARWVTLRRRVNKDAWMVTGG